MSQSRQVGCVTRGFSVDANHDYMVVFQDDLFLIKHLMMAPESVQKYPNHDKKGALHERHVWKDKKRVDFTIF